MPASLEPLRAGGALRPNEALDRALMLAECPAPDNLLRQDDHLLLTSGRRVLLLENLHQESAELEEILHFDGEITALAAAEDGGLAVALDAAGIVLVGGAHDGKTITGLGGEMLTNTTALGFAGADTLFVCVGCDPDAATGAVWRVPLSGGPAACIAADLESPAGLLLHDGRIAVSESARHRLLDFSALDRGLPRLLIDDLPGRPGRLSPAPDGGAWLALVPREPLGLALRLDRDFTPVLSLQGRGDGRRHGVASCLEMRGELIVACKGGDILVSADLLGEAAS